MKDSWLLTKVGLTPNQVRKMTGGDKPPAAKNYLSAEDQKRVSSKLKAYETFIFARFEEGYDPGFIAKTLGVSEESVRRRLRDKGFNKKNQSNSVPQKVSHRDLSE